MNNSSILIVGAERGLGLGLAEFYLSRGWEVFATYYPGSDLASLETLSKSYPGQLSSAPIDVTDKTRIEPFMNQIGVRKFDVIFMIAGIFGPLHQSVLQATDTEFQQIMMTNSFGPARLARHLIPTLSPQGTLCFMTSHRASIAANDDRVHHKTIAIGKDQRALIADGQDRAHQVLVVAHAPGDAVHDDADTLLCQSILPCN